MTGCCEGFRGCGLEEGTHNPERSASGCVWHREKAKGATFFEATEGETVRPMLDVAWAPMLGAFSVLFEEFSEGGAAQCLPEVLEQDATVQIYC